MREQIKKINRTIVRNIFFIIQWLLKLLPYSVIRLLGRFFMLIGHCVMLGKHGLARENLYIAFGKDKDEAERKKIAKDCFNNFAGGMIDLIYCMDHPEEICKRVTIEGERHLQDALKAGKGAIIVSAHFGHFILMYLRLVRQGYKVNVIMRRVHDEVFEEYLCVRRKEHGLKIIYDLPARKCVQQSIKSLRNNELLVIMLDQNYGGDGRVFVDFFGKKAATAAGPVVFSGRTGAPVIPMFILGQENGKHKIVINPPVKLKQGSSKELLTANVAILTNIIEDYVRKYPHEWGGWMHKRWKTTE